MKKIIATLLLTTTVFSSSFANGLTQLEMAKLLVDKAKAEHLIESKEYSEDDVLNFVKTYNLMNITDKSEAVDVASARKILADYDTKKQILILEGDKISSLENLSRVENYEALYNKERRLSHEFMKMLSKENKFTKELGLFASVEGQTFHYEDYDTYPLIDKYRYELYRIFGWYAKEYNMYVHQTPASVALYRKEGDIMAQAMPLIIVFFDESATDDNNDGVRYSVKMKVGALYYVKYNYGETMAEYRKRVLATGFKQPHLVMALRDASSLFIKDEVALNAFVDSYVADVLENEGKEYDYDKDRHEVFGNKRYFISKIQGKVFYYIDHDLSVWED